MVRVGPLIRTPAATGPGSLRVPPSRSEPGVGRDYLFDLRHGDLHQAALRPQEDRKQQETTGSYRQTSSRSGRILKRFRWPFRWPAAHLPRWGSRVRIPSSAPSGSHLTSPFLKFSRFGVLGLSMSCPWLVHDRGRRVPASWEVARCVSGARTPGSCVSTWAPTLTRGGSRGSRRRCTGPGASRAGQLEELVAEAGHARLRAGTLADLLDQWFETASPGRAVNTARHTRSVIDCYVKPHLGHLDVAKLTTVPVLNSPRT
jgi:hypothetical protein